MGWLSLLLGFMDPIEKITQAIVKARADALNAKTEEERISSQERISALQSRQAVLIAEAGVSRINIIVRAGFAFCVLVVIAKLMIWDKVIGSFAGCSGAEHGTCKIFTTDPFDDNQWKVIMIVIGFYFLYEGAMGVSRLVKR